MPTALPWLSQQGRHMISLVPAPVLETPVYDTDLSKGNDKSADAILEVYLLSSYDQSWSP